jgi:MOSC domain-containing protein YiiM
VTARVEAVCVSGADLLPLPDRRPNRSGIDKRPVSGRVAVRELGLDGDVQ